MVCIYNSLNDVPLSLLDASCNILRVSIYALYTRVRVSNDSAKGNSPPSVDQFVEQVPGYGLLWYDKTKTCTYA
jgi:hypothetical protein